MTDKMNDEFQSAADKPMAQRVNELRPKQKEECNKLKEHHQQNINEMKTEHAQKREKAIERALDRYLNNKTRLNYDFAGVPQSYEKKRQEAQQMAEQEVANREAQELNCLSEMNDKETRKEGKAIRAGKPGQGKVLKQEWEKARQKSSPDRDKGHER